MRERVTEIRDIDTMRVDTKYNIADILIKPLTYQRFEELVRLIGMTDGDEEAQK